MKFLLILLCKLDNTYRLTELISSKKQNNLQNGSHLRDFLCSVDFCPLSHLCMSASFFLDSKGMRNICILSSFSNIYSVVFRSNSQSARASLFFR